MSARRTERLLNLVIALRATRRGLRREQIRRAVPQYADSPSDTAFERMFERDKEDLREIGVPVVTVRSDVLVDADDAYRIDAGAYELPPVTFSAAEVAVLALASRVWQQAALAAPATRALTKLRALGADDVGAEEEHAAVRAAAGLMDAGGGMLDPAFDPLHAALRAHRTVRFRYRRPDGQSAVRTVDPWRLLLRGGTWYLVGFDHDRDAPRVFRLGRVEGEVSTVRRPRRRPAPSAAEVTAAVAEAQRVLAPEPLPRHSVRHEAVLRVPPGRGGTLRAVAERAAARARAGPPPADAPDEGSSEGLLRVPWFGPEGTGGDAHPPEWLVDAVAACAPEVVVEAPPALRAAVESAWRTVLMRHSGAPSQAASAAAGQLGRVAERAAATQADPGATWTPGATDRLSRLLAMVPFVLRRDGIGLAELADHFDVSEAQVVRDLQLLFVCGTPGHLPDDLIEADWEGGVVHIGNAEAISRPLRLTGEEAVVLQLGLRLLAGVPGAHDREAVLSATRTLQELIGGVEPLLEVVEPAWGPPEHAETVARALREGRRLRLRYLSAGRDELSDREVDPVRVVLDAGRAYLQAWCHRAQDVRSFRLDRVVAATVLDVPVAPHPDTPGRAPATAWSEGAPTQVVDLRLDRGARWVAEQYPVEAAVHHDGDGHEDGGASTDVRLRVADTDRVVRLVLSLAGACEVLAPADVRQAVAAAAATALASAVTGPGASARAR